MKKININTEVVEMMIYYWTSFKERQKVDDMFIISVAERPEMKDIYTEDFDKESFRKVLSAITNRELLNNASAKEKRFWNNNMWMTEDESVMQAMIDPMKKLNLSDELENIQTKSSFDEVNLVFVPATTETYKINGNTIIINFFKIAVDIFGGTGKVTFEDKDFKQAIIDIIKEA